MIESNGGRFDLCFGELGKFGEDGIKSFGILRIVVLSSRRVSDKGEGFLVKSRTDRIAILIPEILLVAELIGHIEINTRWISESDGVNLDPLFCREFRDDIRIDSHICLTVREEDDDLLSFRVFGLSFLERIHRNQESVPHRCPRKPRDILTNRIGRDPLHRIDEGCIVKCQGR